MRDTRAAVWLRWPLVLPAAIGGYFCIQVIVGLASYFVSLPESWQDFWSQFINSIVGPYCFVWAGAKTAPRHRLIVAWLLAILNGVLSGAVVTAALVYSERVSTPIWWLVVSCVVGVVATIVACVQLRREEMR